ncbi:CMGC/CDK protein kinase [Cladophialophora yegresii CBS 114405]|uniref:cyclin-dependent kinase n=1 Tax=Cladophialophora yegresii CBS 114405 TaxID=1182544 RepID=W9VG31_9EURO|nr:CMGC/CDK protein kinase [Cladophialophora yegresii CBS 114405]EXJ54592.1 CMGC/CDK protein kinase [Cladophialophora yegresii CBS 114405]
MASRSSKWTSADDDQESAAALAQRKKQKEERRRLKEERARNATKQLAPSADAAGSDGRPSKRQRTSPEQGETLPANDQSSVEEGANILQFPHRQFGPCAHVDQFELLNNIEEGSYGVVSRARRKTTGTLVALKKLKMEHTSDGFPVTGLREIQTLRACRHANIVELQEVVMGDGDGSLKDVNVYLVMEFLEHDLATLLGDMAEPFLPSEIKTLTLQIVAGVEYLHRNWILHRDLKTSNLLLNNRGEVKLADFGMARYTSRPPPPKLTQLVVTLWYRAPELLLGAEDYHFEIDIWSVGCIFAELVTKEPLFRGNNEVGQLSSIFGMLGPPTKHTWPGYQSLPNAKALHPLLSNANAKANATTTTLTASKFPYLSTSGLRLLSAMLSLSPTSRPSAAEVLNHAYFKEDPRPKAKEMFPTFPSTANQEKRRRRETPQAPIRGDAPKLDEQDLKGLFVGQAEEEQGAGFALRLG